jgi:hypothetical protein
MHSRNLKLGRLASWLLCLCLMSNVYILTSQFPIPLTPFYCNQFPRLDFGIKGELPASWLSALVSSFLCLASSYLILETYPSTPLRVTKSNAQSRNLKLGRLASWLLCLCHVLILLDTFSVFYSFVFTSLECPSVQARKPVKADAQRRLFSLYGFLAWTTFAFER